MPIIEMHLMVGRPTEKKRAAMAAVAKAAADALECPLSTVRILITEHQPDEFSVGGVSFAEKSETSQTNNPVVTADLSAAPSAASLQS